MWVACMNMKKSKMRILKDVQNKIKTQINNSSINVPKNPYNRIQIRNHPQKKFKIQKINSNRNRIKRTPRTKHNPQTQQLLLNSSKFLPTLKASSQISLTAQNPLPK
jgi:hypothetical protein